MQCAHKVESETEEWSACRGMWDLSDWICRCTTLYFYYYFSCGLGVGQLVIGLLGLPLT